MTDIERIDRLEGFLAKDPANIPLLSEVVEAAVQSGLFARAREALKRARLATPADSPLRHLEATILLAEHRYTEAVELLQGLLRDGAGAAGVVFNLGYACLRAGDPAKGAQYFEALIAQPDAPPSTLAWLMRCRLHAGDPAKAVDDWNEAPVGQRTPAAMAVASLACFDSNRLDEARSLSGAALASGEELLEALIVRASIALADADLQLADGLLQRGRAASPEDGRLRFSCGLASMLRGDLPAARSDFQFAVTRIPGHVGGWIALAWAAIYAQDLAAARASLETAMALDRNFAETHGALAVVDALEGHRDAALAGIARAKRLDPGSASWHYADAVLSGEHAQSANIQSRAKRLLDSKIDIPNLALVAGFRGSD